MEWGWLWFAVGVIVGYLLAYAVELHNDPDGD